ncbi:MAG: hypothetical protein ACKPKO_65745, partial [Candidatus Fonsibacter sp.]
AEEGHYIEKLQDTIADLEREVKETNEQLKTTKKRLAECHGKGGSFRARPEAETLEVTAGEGKLPGSSRGATSP